jgi:hypothetical protein
MVMGQAKGNYFAAARHPWPCFWFLLPLLAAYEGGVLWLGGSQPEMLRNGADTWVRWALQGVGLQQLYWAPIVLAFIFLVWCYARRKDRPGDLIGVTTGMAIESVVFALGLWGISRGLAPLLDRLGIRLDTAAPPSRLVGQIVTYVGAGIYEEVVFRLVLFALLDFVGRWAGLPRTLAFILAALASAGLFSAAHHIGPFGETFEGTIFLFRMLAGVYFAVLFRLRGFGIAVGTHALYDILVGVTISS